jgi:hypothetical protein
LKDKTKALISDGKEITFLLHFNKKEISSTLSSKQKELKEIRWSDNVKARIYDEKQPNIFVKDGNQPSRSQVEVYNYLNSINEKLTE